MKLTQKRSAIMFFSGAGISVTSELFTPLPINQPIVAKPLHNVSEPGHSLYPQILNGQTQLEGFMASQDYTDYFYQEYEKGERQTEKASWMETGGQNGKIPGEARS